MKKLLPVLLLWGLAASLPARNLEVFFVDVEGGQATLFVSPSGESLLVDTGYAGFNNRDANRIAAAAKAAGVRKIDYLVITHYHQDHVGGVGQLAAKMPILNFVDHGPTVENSRAALALYKNYEELRAKGNHIQVKAGDTIPIKGLQVTVLAAAGGVIAAPLPGAGQPNPECASRQEGAAEPSENDQSVGLLLADGEFRILDLGDLTGAGEHDLVCPADKIGRIDVLVVSHHGNDDASAPQFLHAIRPRVAIMGNGANKGGAPRTLDALHKLPGLEDLWQLHYSVIATKAQNAPATFIANPDQNCEGKWLKLELEKDGSFAVSNSRNKYEKAYAKR